MATYIFIAPIDIICPTNRNPHPTGTKKYWRYSALHFARSIQYWRKKWLEHDSANYCAAYTAGDMVAAKRWQKELQKTNKYILEMKKSVSDRLKWAAEARA